MDITRVGGAGSVDPIDPKKRVDRSDEKPSDASSPKDEVNVSDTGKFLNELQSLSSNEVIRSEKVQELSQLIQEGNFETSERLNELADKLADELTSGA